MRRRQILATKQQERRIGPDDNYRPGLSVEADVMKLHAMGLYHYRGIARLTGLSYRRVREIIRDNLGGTAQPDCD